MSDTVAVALIAVAGTLVSGLLSFLAARHNTKAQLASVNSEMERLRQGQEETQREARKDLYRDYLAKMANIQHHARGLGNEGTINEVGIKAIGQLGELQLLSPQEVVIRAEALTEVFGSFSSACAELYRENIERIEKGEAERSDVEITRLAMDRTSDEWRAARDELLEAMRADLGTEAVQPA